MDKEIINEEKRERNRLRRAKYTDMTRLQRMKLSLANVEGMAILEGIADDEKWRKSLETMKKVLQEWPTKEV